MVIFAVLNFRIMSKPVSLMSGVVGGLLACFALYQIVLGLWSGQIYAAWTFIHGSYVSFSNQPAFFCLGVFGYIVAFVLGCAAILAMMIFSDEAPD